MGVLRRRHDTASIPGRAFPRGPRRRAAAAGHGRDHRLCRHDGETRGLQGAIPVRWRRGRQLAGHAGPGHQHDGGRTHRRTPHRGCHPTAAAGRYRHRLGRRIQHRAHDPFVRARRRCGHRPGKEVVSKGEMVDRVKAAVDARTDPAFVIMARTDAAAVEGIDAAIDRACAYVEAGADMIFPEAMKTLADYRRFKAAVKVPILANLTEFGSTPFFTTDELREAGVDIALYCCGAYRAMNKAALNFYETVRREGTQKNIIDTLQTREELYDFLGYHAYEDKLDALFAGDGEG